MSKRYLVVVPIIPGSKIKIVLEARRAREGAMEAARLRRKNASPGSIHRLCRVVQCKKRR